MVDIRLIISGNFLHVALFFHTSSVEIAPPPLPHLDRCVELHGGKQGQEFDNAVSNMARYLK
jgi:hypothetical protein